MMSDMPTNAITKALPDAARLVCAVAARDEPESHTLLRNLTHDELMAVAVILAASVDPDRPLLTAPTTPEAVDQSRVATIVRNVGYHCGVTADDICGPSRERQIVEARQVVCWIAASEEIGTSAIGRGINRDHATAFHSIEKVTRTPHLLAHAREISDHMKKRAA